MSLKFPFVWKPNFGDFLLLNLFRFHQRGSPAATLTGWDSSVGSGRGLCGGRGAGARIVPQWGPGEHPWTLAQLGLGCYPKL